MGDPQKTITLEAVINTVKANNLTGNMAERGKEIMAGLTSLEASFSLRCHLFTFYKFV